MVLTCAIGSLRWLWHLYVLYLRKGESIVLFDAKLVIMWQLRDAISWRQCIDPSDICTPRGRFFEFGSRNRKFAVVTHIKRRCGFVANCCGKGGSTVASSVTLIKPCISTLPCLRVVAHLCNSCIMCGPFYQFVNLKLKFFSDIACLILILHLLQA